MKRPPKETAESTRRIARRSLLIGTAQLGMIGVLGWRMRSMQVEEGEIYRNLAEENRINMRLIPPSRGLIFDRNGVPLAVNEQNYRIIITREDAGDVDDTLDRLARLISLPEEAIEDAKAEMARRPGFVPVTVAERVPWDDVAKVTVNTPALPGITAEVGLSRHYPRGSDTAHVVGYVGPVSDYEIGRAHV